MIEFDMRRFLFEKRLLPGDVADATGITAQGVYKMRKNGRVKLNFLGKMETIYGDLSDYILSETPQTMPSN